MKRSDPSDRLYASEVSCSGMACPNEMVAGFRRPPHSWHRGAFSPAATRFWTSSLSYLCPHVRQETWSAVAVQLQHPACRVSGLEMEAVYVLGNQAVELAHPLKLGNGQVALRWGGRPSSSRTSPWPCASSWRATFHLKGTSGSRNRRGRTCPIRLRGS